MAIFTGSERQFEITAVSFSPNVITFGETVSVSVTIKNVSGKSVSKMYITVEGSYARPNTTSPGYCGTGDVYLHGSQFFNMASVSWANGASKTFTFNYAFTKGFYDVDLSSYFLSKKMFLTIVTGTTFSTGGNYENFEDISNGYLTVISARDNPRLSMKLDRCSGGQLNDEGESLLASIKLDCDTTADAFKAHGYTASISCTPALSGGCAFTPTIANLLTGVVNSSTAISGTFSNGSDYTITVTVTNGYETAVAKQDVARAFANVHMSGQPTGGVCFGGFSSAEQNKPKFECYFPAYFYGGIPSEQYKNGDVVTLTGGTFYGYVSGSTKNIYFTIPLRKSLEKIKSATITTLKANIANSGGYGISSAHVSGGSNYISSSITRSVQVLRETNELQVTLVRSSAWSLTNNNTLSVRNESMVITLYE